MERSFNENAKLIPTVFCFPFAGGSGYSYNGFKKCAKNVRIQPIEIPGRGKRIVENLISDIELIADDAFAQIRNNLGSPYAIYGHSMGSIIAYLTTVRIVDAALPKPMHVFVSGRGGPVMEERDLPAYDLPRHQFFSKLKEMGGSPTDLLDDPDIASHFEPILRADFKAIEKYQYRQHDPLDVPLTCFIGNDEGVTDDEVQGWQRETLHSLEVVRFPGKHFFIFEHEQEIISIMERTLLARTAPQSI